MDVGAGWHQSVAHLQSFKGEIVQDQGKRVLRRRYSANERSNQLHVTFVALYRGVQQAQRRLNHHLGVTLKQCPVRVGDVVLATEPVGRSRTVKPGTRIRVTSIACLAVFKDRARKRKPFMRWTAVGSILKESGEPTARQACWARYVE